MAERAAIRVGQGPLKGGTAGATQPPTEPLRLSLLTRIERSVYRGLVRFLARRFAWEALVSRQPDSHYRAYARMMDRIANDMAAEDESFLHDHPLPRRGHLTVIK